MYVSEPPKRYVDEQDGQPIQQIRPASSMFDQVEVKGNGEALLVMARESATGNIVKMEAALSDKTLRGVFVESESRRRDVRDDLQDALELLGYTVLDQEVQQY